MGGDEQPAVRPDTQVVRRPIQRGTAAGGEKGAGARRTLVATDGAVAAGGDVEHLPLAVEGEPVGEGQISCRDSKALAIEDQEKTAVKSQEVAEVAAEAGARAVVVGDEEAVLVERLDVVEPDQPLGILDRPEQAKPVAVDLQHPDRVVDRAGSRAWRRRTAVDHEETRSLTRQQADPMWPEGGTAQRLRRDVHRFG